MEIEVRLRGAFIDRLPNGRGSVELPDGAAVEEILKTLELPGLQCVYVVNGGPVKRGTPLRQGDRVEIYPPTAGG